MLRLVLFFGLSVSCLAAWWLAVIVMATPVGQEARAVHGDTIDRALWAFALGQLVIVLGAAIGKFLRTESRRTSADGFVYCPRCTRKLSPNTLRCPECQQSMDPVPSSVRNLAVAIAILMILGLAISLISSNGKPVLQGILAQPSTDSNIDAGATRAFWTDVTHLWVPLDATERPELFARSAEHLDRLDVTHVDPNVAHFARDLAVLYRKYWDLVNGAEERGRSGQAFNSEETFRRADALTTEALQLSSKYRDTDAYVRAKYQY